MANEPHIIDSLTDDQLRQLSSKDLEYLAADKIEKMSNAGLEILSPTPVPSGTTTSRGASMIARGLASPVLGATAGTALGAATFPPAIPVLAGAGTLAVPAADILTAGWNKITPESYNVKYPSQSIQDLLTKAGVPTPQNILERSLVAGGGALGGTTGQVPALANLATTAESQVGRGIAENLAQAPIRQMAVSAPAAAAGQATEDLTNNPYLAMLASAATGAAGGIGTKTGGLTREELKAQSDTLFQTAKDSGIKLNSKPFQSSMKNITSTLRQEGYTPTGFPKLKGVVDELTTSTQPKDFVELKALRKMIQGAQASPDADERRLASILKDKFDNYVVNIPSRDISVTSGNAQQGMQAWADARNAYSRLSKADIFEDMTKRAEMNATKYTQSGAENAIVADLRNLANNKSKMRLFTADEQKEIRDAVKGGSVQNALRFMGKYAPTSPLVAGSEALLASAAGGQLGGTSGAIMGAAVPIVGTAARMAATKMRENQLANLVDLMRRGGKNPTQVSSTATLGLRGLLSDLQGQ